MQARTGYPRGRPVPEEKVKGADWGEPAPLSRAMVVWGDNHRCITDYRVPSGFTKHFYDTSYLFYR